MTRPEIAVRRYVPARIQSGAPVLLLHGFASDGASDWEEPGWPEALTSAGRMALVVDLPGHGHSPAPRNHAEVLPSVLARTLGEIVEHEAGEDFDVIGYSMGARLAWELPGTASRKVAHLVLGGLSALEPFGAVDTALIAKCIENGQAPADPLHAAIAGMVTGQGQDSRSLLTCVDGLRAEPFEPRAGQIAAPTLLVAGSADAMTEGIGEFATMLETGSLTHVPGDHRAALHSEDFRRAATSFITAG